jgi:inhibitor of cysteine peptidase
MGGFEVAELGLTRVDSGKTFEVHSDDMIVTRLPENPTTGYRWAIDEIDEEALKLEESGFALISGADIGGTGERRLSFKAKRTGTTHVELKLWREWEGDKSVSDHYDFTIHVL